jgi:hypothetical protein
MEGVGILIGVILYFCIIGIPIMQILHRVGHSRAWILIMFVPVVNLVFLWIFAFKRWPVEG